MPIYRGRILDVLPFFCISFLLPNSRISVVEYIYHSKSALKHVYVCILHKNRREKGKTQNRKISHPKSIAINSHST
jgi:hypothetical protein